MSYQPDLLLLMLTLITCLRWCLSGFCTIKKWVQPTLRGRALKYHLMEEVVLKDLWIYVKTTTVIIKYLEVDIVKLIIFFKVLLTGFSIYHWILSTAIIIMVFWGNSFLRKIYLFAPSCKFIKSLFNNSTWKCSHHIKKKKGNWEAIDVLTNLILVIIS